jgi:hypothetical protein
MPDLAQDRYVIPAARANGNMRIAAVAEAGLIFRVMLG